MPNLACKLASLIDNGILDHDVFFLAWPRLQMLVVIKKSLTLCLKLCLTFLVQNCENHPVKKKKLLGS